MTSGKVLVVFRNFPLDGHANATPAAAAARCAGQQDPALFWRLHDWLYANLSAWSGKSDAAGDFRAQALSLGADGDRYDDCIADPRTADAIRNDVAEGAALGVRGTPAFVLSRLDTQGKATETRALSGALPYERFVEVIESLLAQS